MIICKFLHDARQGLSRTKVIPYVTIFILFLKHYFLELR